MAKLKVGVNDLYTWCKQNNRENLLKEWDLKKNNTLTPYQVSIGVERKVWWKCKKGHSWSSSVNVSVKGHNSCPYCSNRKVLKGYNDLETVYPEIAKEWDYTKNGILTPDNILYGSSKKVWWKCKKKHEWAAYISKRTRDKNGCPYCKGKLADKGVTDLLSKRPDLAIQWDYEKNYPLKPENVTLGSNKKIHWICNICGNRWSSVLNSRTNNKTNYCPKCLLGLHTSYPEQFIYLSLKTIFNNIKNREKIGGREADVYIEELKLVIEYDGNHFHTNKNSKKIEDKKDEYFKSQGLTCLRVKEKRDLKTIVQENNIIYVSFHNNNFNKLVEIVSRIIGWINSNYDLKFEIDITEDIEIKVVERLSRLNRDESLARNYPEIAKEMHPTKNGDIKPESLAKCSMVKLWWLCPDCGHEYKASVASRTRLKSNCIKCHHKNTSIRRSTSIIGVNDLVSQYSEVLKCWNYEKNERKPEEVCKSSSYIAHWKCNVCMHEWLASVNSVTRSKITGSGCPVCAGQIVKEGYNDLKTKAPWVLIDWAYDLNDIKPTEVTKGTIKKVFWRCHNCEKEWENKIVNEVYRKTRGCTTCKVPIENQ